MEKKEIIPTHHQMTEFLRGQASKIFDDVAKNDEVVLVNKNSKPQNIIISYERYCRLKENGADI
jgi:prevent-host-death family protein